jgi:hypothetical protein
MVKAVASIRWGSLLLIVCCSLALWGCQWLDPTQMKCSGLSDERCDVEPGYTCDLEAGLCVASSPSGDDPISGVLNGGGGASDDDDDTSGDDDDDTSGDDDDTSVGTGCIDDAYEENDVFGTAADLTLVAQQQLVLDSLKSCDEDWFSFVFPAGATEMSLVVAFNSGDLDLVFYNDQKFPLDQQNGNGNSEEIVLVLNSGQRYFLQVHGAFEEYDGLDYTLTISTSAASSGGA